MRRISRVDALAGPVEARATVVGRAEVAGRRLLTLEAGEVARLASPGQFAMLRCGAGLDPYLRRALPFLHLAGETVSFLFAPAEPGLEWLAGRALGDRVSLIGPLGRGYGLHPATRRLLLATVGGPVAPLLALAGLALGREVSVSLGLSPGLARELGPIIPGSVEVMPAEGEGATDAVWELVASTLAWADQAAVSGAEAELGRLAHHPGMARASNVECYVSAPMACGLGWCGSCLTGTHRGLRRACTGGPVFDLRELT